MNLNKLTLVCIAAFAFSTFSYTGCEKKETLTDVVETNLVKENTSPQKSPDEVLTLEEQYPQVFPEMLSMEQDVIDNTKQYASLLLGKIGLSLEDVHLGIYLGKTDYVCFHHGEKACLVFILGSPNILWRDFNEDIIIAPSYTENHGGPYGMPLIVMPNYKSKIAGELILVHEFTHAEQDCRQDFSILEYESRIASYEYFKREYPQVFNRLISSTKNMYHGEFNEKLFRACETFAHSMGVPELERWFLTQDFNMIVAMYDLEQKEQLNVATVNNLIFAVGAFYQQMSESAKTTTTAL